MDDVMPPGKFIGYIRSQPTLKGAELTSFMIGAVEVRDTQIEARAKREAVPQWQPIESAPKDGTRLILWDGNKNYDDHVVIGGFYSERYTDEDTNKDYDGPLEWQTDSRTLFPTHWMYLPAPPAASKQEPTSTGDDE